MEYTPRYAQPFTLNQAIQLDIPVITEEIARLQNSLQHLRETQELLGQYITENPDDQDPEIDKAFEENETVIGSQEERIGILRMALAEKGVILASHYTASPSNSVPAERDAVQRSTDPVTGDQMNGVIAESDDDDGIHL
ncbi:uncharacterized protein EV420DRAFT_452831 [Desarmillaria tabescens]|uniref:Uncharacterized protein n=1 Tax=Armillaria tabescens TaxID=1929756 RepID=A0AA39NMD3_ARMTA|nr:uncharacterized protein EV420DRAFT_452831 [Desarmillaria tabescens]KAK0468230.1 hypothetical protein EV420DRAFT_452831 [Desarmillaria tabescens]